MSYTKSRARRVAGTILVAAVTGTGEHSEVRYSDRISAPSVTPQLSVIKVILQSHLLFLYFNSNAR